MTFAPAAVLSGFVALAVLSAPAPDPAFREELAAARAALERHDGLAARPHLLRVDSIVNGHPGAMAALAAIAARQGEREEALRWMRDFAATGLARRFDRDTNFAGLAADPDFRAIAARLDSNGAPRTAAALAVRLPDAALLAEDVAWDAKRRRFLVSSIHERKILAVTPAGRASDWVRAGADAWGFYGLTIDAARGRLWATTAAGPEVQGYSPADSGRAALLAFDLGTARPLARAELPRDGARHVLGDLTVGPDGAVYVTDSVGGGVYRLRPGAAALDTLAPAGSFASPQQPALAPGGARLLLPDYPRGIAALDLASGAVTWLLKPRTLAAGGIDGLLRDGDRLIAIQNGTNPHRVIELTLDAGATAITGWRVLEQGSEWLGEPNHGALVGRDLVFLGNSGWERVNEKEELESPADARPPVLLRLRLGR